VRRRPRRRAAAHLPRRAAARDGSGAVRPGQRPSVGWLRHGDPWQVLRQTGQRLVTDTVRQNVQNVHVELYSNSSDICPPYRAWPAGRAELARGCRGGLFSGRADRSCRAAPAHRWPGALLQPRVLNCAWQRPRTPCRAQWLAAPTAGSRRVSGRSGRAGAQARQHQLGAARAARALDGSTGVPHGACVQLKCRWRARTRARLRRPGMAASMTGCPAPLRRRSRAITASPLHGARARTRTAAQPWRANPCCALTHARAVRRHRGAASRTRSKKDTGGSRAPVSGVRRGARCAGLQFTNALVTLSVPVICANYATAARSPTAHEQRCQKA